MKKPRWSLLLLGVFLSPTRLLIQDLKENLEDAKPLLTAWNLFFFGLEIGIVLALGTLSWSEYFWLPLSLGFALLWIAISRCNEIVYAFYADTMDKLDEKKSNTNLSPSDRIKMLMRSYFGLTTNFALIYYLLPTLYEPKLSSFATAFYFSGVTIATLGYGDIKPIDQASQLLAVYEVFSGILLVVLALAVYLAGLGGKTKQHSC
ncbi:MAG: two pore domain potassium channel family protein [Polaromonas sp.]|nr:two pore domain potassium channel family protein [Polaromonas sp.]